MKIKLNSQQDLVNLLLLNTQIRLSRQDRGFLQNISNLLHTQQPITTNQVWLMNTLTDKYNKQLSKHTDTIDLKNLPWDSKIILSDIKYTDSYIDIVGGKIYFRCPYNNKFITNLRNASGNELFVWEKNNKRYIADFSTISFKLIVTLAFANFHTVHCCPITKSLIEQLSFYDKVDSYWNPTLTKVNNQIVIAATNKYINDYLEKINFSYQITPKNLAILVRMAITIDNCLIDNSELEFASTYNPIVELKELDKLPSLLKNVGCDLVYTVFDNFYANHRTTLQELLEKVGIRMTMDKCEVRKYKFPVLLKFRQFNQFEQNQQHIGKIIQVVNREPINIK